MLADLLFVMFGAGVLLGAGAVVAARNPMYCVLGMLFMFLNAAGLFVLFTAEFLGLLLIMIYVGAVAVMFLFVLMTMDLDFSTLKEGFAPYLPVGLLVVGAFAAQLIFAVWAGLFQAPLPPVKNAVGGSENIVALGQVLYTTYAIPFQLAGLILLTAMIGAILLTFRPRGDVRRQNVSAQVLRDKSDCYVITQPGIGQGATAQHWAPKPVAKTVKVER